MKAVLIRHTRVEIPPEVCYGRSDVPLAATFLAEAASVRATLPWTPVVVWTSPAERCRRLAGQLGVAAVRIDDRLQELDFGQWEGRRWEDFRGAQSEAWANDPWSVRPPGGETTAELCDRVREFRADLIAEDCTRVAIVTHAGVIRAWRSIAADKPLQDCFSEKIGWGAVELCG
jgi:alpha-ribazole phosphatase